MIPAFTHALVHPGYTLPPPLTEAEKAALHATPWGSHKRQERARQFLDFVRAQGIADATDFITAEKRKLAILHAGLVQFYDAQDR